VPGYSHESLRDKKSPRVEACFQRCLSYRRAPYCKSKNAILSATIATISAKISVLIPLVERNRTAREGRGGVLSGVPGTC
jgi:hypothetical protein